MMNVQTAARSIQLRAPINNGNRYCGPAVISAVTGIGTADAARVIRKLTGAEVVKGTHDYQLRKAFDALGIRMTPVRLPETSCKVLTLAGWLKAAKAQRTAGRVFLISAGHHWQIVSGRRYVCGRISDVVSVRHAKIKRRAQVKAVWELITFGDVKDGAHLIKPEVKRESNGAYRKARALVKLIGAELERWDDIDPQADHEPEYFVYPPDCISEDDDPWDGDHLATGWSEILSRLEKYKSMIKT